MMICKECKATSIKSRKNYPHGRKSKASTTFICRNCGSLNINLKSDNRRRNSYKRK